MKFLSFVSTFALLSNSANGQTCGPAGTFTTAGSTTVAPITEALAVNYIKKCGSAYKIALNATGSSDGAKKVCNSGGTVDIGNMSRDWKTSEASKAANGTTFTCVIGSGARSVHRIPVAIDGVVVFFEKGGTFETNCGSKLNAGVGLSTAQLRWIYSNLTDLETTAIPNRDSDSSTHKWIELNPSCPNVEIRRAAPSSIYGTHDFFKEVIFQDGAKENFRSGTFFENDNSIALLNQVLNNDNTVGFFGYGYFTEQGAITAFEIDGQVPSDETLGGDLYFPLGRRIYSNFWNGAVKNTKCFADMHFTTFGEALVTGTGFLSIPAEEYPVLKKIVPGSCCPPCVWWRRLFGLCPAC